MEHVVFYPGPTGAPAFQRLSSLEAAVSYVERLRNGANVTEFSVYELTPVPLSMRAYYRVEVPAHEALAGLEPDGDSAPEPPTMSPQVEAVVAEEPSEPLAVPAVEQAVQFALGDASSDSIVRPQVIVAEVSPTPEPPAVESVAVDVESVAVVNEPVAIESEPVAAEPVPPAMPVITVTADKPKPTPPVTVAPVAVALEPVVAEPVVGAVVEDIAAPFADTSDLLAAVAAASVTALPPTAADDDDRSAEWVAEASVIEPAYEAASVKAPVDEPSIASTPFGAAPPVDAMPTDADAQSDAQSDAQTDGQPDASAANVATADIIPSLPAGRRSMGFFAR